MGIRTGNYHLCCPSGSFCLNSFCSYTFQAFKRSISAYEYSKWSYYTYRESNCLTHTSRVTTFAGSSKILGPQSTLICFRVNVKVMNFIKKLKKVGSDNYTNTYREFLLGWRTHREGKREVITNRFQSPIPILEPSANSTGLEFRWKGRMGRVGPMFGQKYVIIIHISFFFRSTIFL